MYLWCWSQVCILLCGRLYIVGCLALCVLEPVVDLTVGVTFIRGKSANIYQFHASIVCSSSAHHSFEALQYTRIVRKSSEQVMWGRVPYKCPYNTLFATSADKEKNTHTKDRETETDGEKERETNVKYSTTCQRTSLYATVVAFAFPVLIVRFTLFDTQISIMHAQVQLVLLSIGLYMRLLTQSRIGDSEEGFPNIAVIT